jgi:hypothetical protein
MVSGSRTARIIDKAPRPSIRRERHRIIRREPQDDQVYLFS